MIFYIKKLRKSAFFNLTLYYIDGRYVFLTRNRLKQLERRLGFPEEGIEPLETHEERRKKYIPNDEKRAIISDFLKSKRQKDEKKFFNEWVVLNLTLDKDIDDFDEIINYQFQLTNYGYIIRADEIHRRRILYSQSEIKSHDPDYDPQNYFAIICKRRFFKKVRRFSTVIFIDKRKIKRVIGVIGMNISVWGEDFRLNCSGNRRFDQRERSIRLFL